ncbi:class I adenylate-forming enzyme family protein [Prescottella agglutinans]|uniref:Long-chain acyl-CoA synthetase n=1 Tax=Prescottella agglutinans TaxID=1644129 RepID=A0ABT6M8P1_9NOCA|nr:AMP-binding protein [Prescottella agglutinans]MDH6280676.1 long-chain acyl-CoA synthetase [Prescottella agglutinans]
MTSPKRPWLAGFRAEHSGSITPDFDNALAMFDAAVQRAPEAVALHYFDGTVTYGELSAAADALACHLQELGFGRGDRLALCTQNNPAFLIGVVAAWRAGGTPVALSPMCKEREFAHFVNDCEPKALLVLEDVFETVAPAALRACPVENVVTVSALDGQSRHDPRLFASARRIPTGATDLYELVAAHDRTRRPTIADSPTPDDLAMIMYTSGTTGVPKGAMLSHRNLVFSAHVYRDWAQLGPSDRVLGLSPLFHISGLVGHVMVSFLLGSPLVLSHRFHPEVMLDSVREHRPTFAMAAITAYIALADAGADAADLDSLSALYSGGAPVSPTVLARLETTFGKYIHNMYGLTETSSPSHAVPLGRRAPVDPETGVLSVGIPVYNTDVRVIDDEGRDVPVGDVGELVTTGPQVVAGYWPNADADETETGTNTFLTGDVGFMDHDGWFYVLDRKNDVINASGYKIWPREVEEVLLNHPDVREAAVVCIPDDYRGESVKAFVVVREGAELSELDLIEHGRRSMAAFKYPREVQFVSALPRTVTGKLIRSQL